MRVVIADDALLIREGIATLLVEQTSTSSSRSITRMRSSRAFASCARTWQ
jgi:hypothetical protein